MRFICDKYRHLICVPYSVENLHQMADKLGIKRHWFHKNHYDIPLKRVGEITSLCEVVRTRDIIKIINESNTNASRAQRA